MSGPARAASMVAALHAGETGVSAGAHAAADAAAAEADLFRAFEEDIEGRDGVLAPPKRRGPGRPPGAVNRTTLQLQRFLTARGYRDPVEGLAAIASADPRELGDALCEGIGGLKPEHRLGAREKALAVIRQAQVDLAGYFHQRAPVRVDVTPGDMSARPLFVIGTGPMQVNVGAGEQNQGVTTIDAAVSDGGASDEWGK